VPVPILMINRSKELWGPDAHEWKPARWLKHGRSGAVPEAARSVPGVWGHVLTFIGGPKACIGFKFSLIEFVPPFASARRRYTN
jgi:cytochrome P450